MYSKKRKLLVAMTIILTMIYLLWRVFYTLPFGYGLIALIFGLYLLIAEILGMFEQMVHFYTMAGIVTPERPEVEENDFPTVSVFIATYNEPVELLYKTINGCLNMDYPDKKKVTIYVCDDGNREEMKQLASKLGVQYLAREDHEGAKAGNLNYGLAHSESDLVVTFDADMIPMSDFLTSTVPYFVPDLINAKQIELEEGMEARKEREGKIGFIQTPQSFYNLDLFQYNLFSEERIPNEQDYFYKNIQVAKNKSNSVIYGGSNTVISREALDEIGGFCTTVITEDFATGIMIQSNGYRCYAIDEVHASGLSPEDLKNLVKQRKRWARGCIQSGRKLNILFRKGLSMTQKISYLNSISYWYDSFKRLIYLAAPIIYSVFGVTIFVATPLQFLIFWLPMYLVNNATLKILSGNIRNVRWTNVYETIMFPLILPDVILETLCISQKKFSVTNKGGAQEDKQFQLYHAIPHIILAVLTGFGIFNTIVVTFRTGTITTMFLLFWLLVNFFNLIMAIFFMLGRKVQRKSERFQISAHVTIKTSQKLYEAKTYDISEGGFSILLKHPEYITPDVAHSVSMKENGYEATFTARIVQVAHTKEGYRYAFEIDVIKEKDYRQLLHILYDRVPPLTHTIQSNQGFFDDIAINIQKRKTPVYSFSRKLPRVPIRRTFYTTEGEAAFIYDFNYRYITIQGTTPVEKDGAIYVNFGAAVPLQLQFDKALPYEKESNILLYVVLNYSDFIVDENFPILLSHYNSQYKREKENEQKRKKEEQDNELQSVLDYL